MQKTVTIDDIDESEGAETRDFSLEGVDYEIDLVETNMEELRKALAPFIESARKVHRSGRRAHKPTPRVTHVPASGVHNNEAIREWARKRNMKVSDRGRIPREVEAAFDEAHKSKGDALFSSAGA